MLPTFTLSCFITAISSLVFGYIVLQGDAKNKANRLWFLMTISTALWSFSLGMEVSSPNYSTAFFWNKLLNLGAIFISIFFYHFTILFLEKNKNLRERIFLIIGYCLSAIFLFFNFFTKLFVTGVPPKAGFNYWIEVGPVYYLFFVIFVFYFSWSAVLLLQGRKTTSIVQKRRIDYILLAILFGAGGGITNFFPQIFDIYPFGNYFVILYVIFISYAVLKHHLFDLKVIATELFTFAMWILLLVKFLLSNSLQELILNGGLLLAFIFFGILLIKSVLKEVRLREQIEKLAKEIKRAYEVEKKANAELEKLDKYKNDFMRQTQHDLRSPLAVLMGFSDLLMSGAYGKLPKKAKEVIVKMQDVIQGKIKDVNNFLDTEQFKQGKGVVMLKPGVEVMTILGEVVSTLTSKAQVKNIYLKLQKPPTSAQGYGEAKENVISVSADREKLKAALYNIVDNALKYTEKGGVDIKVETTGESIKIIIADTGIGLPPEKIKNMFEIQFDRTEKAKKMATGFGVGLYLSGQIIKMHNGKIWAESEGEGKGSTFYVELPCKGE
jgi:signal transduction histidine kinase